MVEDLVTGSIFDATGEGREERLIDDYYCRRVETQKTISRVLVWAKRKTPNSFLPYTSWYRWNSSDVEYWRLPKLNGSISFARTWCGCPYFRAGEMAV